MNRNKYKKTVYPIMEDSNDSDSDDKGEVQLWCFCRSSDSSRFMIACDSCEEWYHGDCVNVSPKMAESIKKYFCSTCQKKNPSLKIVYKPGVVVCKPKDKIEKFDKTEKFDKREKIYPKIEKVEKDERLIRPKIEEKLTAPPIKTNKIIKHNCGQCIGCMRKVDCNVCLNCRAKTGLPCLSRMCQKKQAPIVDKPQEKTFKPQEKVFRPQEKVFKPQEKIFKPQEKIFKPQEKIVRPPEKVMKPLEKIEKVVKIPEKIVKPQEKVIKPQEKMMLTKLPMDFIPMKSVPPKKIIVNRPILPHQASIHSSSSSVCSETNSRPMKRPVSPSSNSGSGSTVSIAKNKKKYPLPPTKKLKLEYEHQPSKSMHMQQNASRASSELSMNSEDDDVDEDEDDEDVDESSSDDKSGSSEGSQSQDDHKPARFAQARPTKKPQIKLQISRPLVMKKKPSNSDLQIVKKRAPRQVEPEPLKNYKSFECDNIGCTKPSRMGSKYCSDECGISLAEQRLLTYLPERINNWNNSVCISEERDKDLQVDIKEELRTILYNLDILNTSHHDLTDFIERWRAPYNVANTTEPGTNDDNVQCVTCGSMVNSLKAQAHMENCYQKIEGATMVFADFEEQPIGTKLFCDFYDSNIRGYCKRLAALCDHNKDPKIDPKTICAFPLSVNEKSDNVCMTSRVKCNRHINWERIQRAVIDLNRYRLLVRYEELQMEDRKIKQNMAQRGSVMALLMHETVDHQPLKPMLPIKASDRNKRMKKFTKAVCI